MNVNKDAIFACIRKLCPIIKQKIMSKEKSMKRDFSNFSKEQIRDFWIDFSNKTDFKNPILSYGYYKAIKDNLNGFTAFNTVFKEKEKLFTRARIHNSKRTLFPNISDVWYPPDEYVNVGRANFPNNSVFYCSNDPGTTIFEVRPEKGDWLTSLEIEIKKDELDLLILGVNTETIPAFEKLSEVDKGINMFLEEKFREIIPKGKEHNYFKTAYFTEAFLKNKDGLMYPSVGSNCKGWNVIFTKEFIDKYGILTKAVVHEVIEKKSEYDITIKCNHIATHINQYGDFIWETVTDCNGHLITERIYD